MYLKVFGEKYDNLQLMVEQYMHDDSIYLGLWSNTEGLVSDITVNVDVQRYLNDPMLVAINHDYESYLLDFIRRYGIGVVTDFFIPSGYVDFTVIRLNPNKILELTNDKEKTSKIFKKLNIPFKESSDLSVG